MERNNNHRIYSMVQLTAGRWIQKWRESRELGRGGPVDVVVRNEKCICDVHVKLKKRWKWNRKKSENTEELFSFPTLHMFYNFKIMFPIKTIFLNEIII